MRKIIVLAALFGLITAVGVPSALIPASVQSPMMMHQFEKQIPPRIQQTEPRKKTEPSAKLSDKKVKSAISMILMFGMMGVGGNS